ncbi:unnamed protein product [Victoria cruziana]
MERLAFVAELLVSLQDEDPTVVKRSIVSGTHLFCSALEEIALQFRQSGEAEKYLQELWLGISKFKDAVFSIFLKHGLVGTRLIAVKFIETFILFFLPETNGPDLQSMAQTREGKSQRFNISWLLGSFPIRDLDTLIQEADKQLHLLLEQLESPNLLPSSVIIALVNCLAAIARKRPLYYNRILSALISFNPNFESDGSHVSSIQYSLRTAFLSFLKCTNVVMIASRDRLIGVLRCMNAGEAADQVIRHIEKMIKNSERVGDSRYTKEEQLSSQMSNSGDFSRKRPIIHDNGRTAVFEDTSPKQARSVPVQSSSGLASDVGSTEECARSSLMGGDMTPVEQMIALIGALLAEGDRGAKSLEILISNFHPDLLADIVMANMKYLPKSPPLSSKAVLPSTTSQTNSSSIPLQVPPSTITVVAQSSDFPSQATALTAPNGTVLPALDTLPVGSNLADMKRDPRRDPRRLDPRRAAMPAGSQSTIVMVEDSGGVQSGLYTVDLSATSRPHLHPVTAKNEDTLVPLAWKAGAVASAESVIPAAIPVVNDVSELLQESFDAENAATIHTPEDKDTFSDPLDLEEQTSVSVEAATSETIDAGSANESDQYSSAVSSSTTSEDTNSNLVIPPFLELSNEDQESLGKSAVTRIIEAYNQAHAAGGSHVRLALLARLVAEIDDNNSVVMMLQRHIVADYQHQKGHDLSMHILYHLHAAMVSQSGGCNFLYYESIYEQFLVSVAKNLRDNLPASDKSLSRLLGEAPVLPNSALQLLEQLCHPEPVEHNGHEVYNVEVERVTQGLGALWNLILVRPLVRGSCLDIVLKSAVHAQDDVRAKAIRLVANKLYHLSYLSEEIEQFATNMLLSVVDIELSPNADVDQRMRYEGHETSTGGSQSSEPCATDSDSIKGDTKFADNAQRMSSPKAQRCMSLYFALCTKKPSLLQLVFSVYGRSQKAVKQVIHRHIPILVRNIGSSYSELLRIISEPPHGSENLMILVLQTLTADCTPAPDLIATVKKLYETKLKDAAILIPILSLLSKDEVLPIFPKLVLLPLEKFKNALDYILQGSAHTGPALTPVEVLVAIHGINPEKDGIALKKITDACTACFVQRTVFTQQVLAKALNQLVEQIPLPLLFMRTVIQAIDAFPALVDFVMGILSRLVSKQIWQMPKLWVGFLKCAYQTQPHSFNVLLQLPAPQLESALNKHTSLRVPLAAYANQPSIRTTLPRSILAVLGLVNEKLPPTFMQVSASQSSESCSSVQSTTPT